MFGQNPRHTGNAADYKPLAIAEEEKPSKFSLRNRPNPFNPATTIEYNLPRNTNARLEIYNSGGQLVDVLFDEFQIQGQHQVIFNPNNSASGVYLYRLKTQFGSKTKKMVLLK